MVSPESPTITDERFQPRYYPVSTTKLVVLSILTGGIYEIYWFYKNWKVIKERDSSDIWPFPRAVFSVLFYYPFLDDLGRHEGPHGKVPVPGAPALAALYFGLAAVWQLPDPWWLVSWFTFVPLIPAARRIAELNRFAPETMAENSRWRIRHGVLLVLAAPLVLFMFVSSLNLVPSTQVISGSIVWEWDREWMRDHGVLEPGEELLWFYSNGVLSIESDGNLLTDRRIVSYWEDELGAFFIEEAAFAEVKEIQQEPTESVLDPIVVTVERHDGSSFRIVLSDEDDRHQHFLRDLRARL
jgi:hypothetical protein